MLLTCGVLSIVGVLAFVARMRFTDHEEILPLKAFLYLPWLLWEILKANVDVAKRILSPSLPISPRLIKVRASQKRELGRVIYANSITLTPGTVSVRMEDDVITVHALTAEAADGVKTGVMDAKVTKLEGLS
jgi:multicomponent Na+:H+ antiporter subunit E